MGNSNKQKEIYIIYIFVFCQNFRKFAKQTDKKMDNEEKKPTEEKEEKVLEEEQLAKHKNILKEIFSKCYWDYFWKKYKLKYTILWSLIFFP